MLKSLKLSACPHPTSARFSGQFSGQFAVWCLAGALLAGCAAKNPLIDEPVAQAKTPAATASSPVASNAAAAPASPEENTSVKTEEPSAIKRFINRWFSPYKVDVQQGNFVSREMVAQLREGAQRPDGVTREQVRFALGTPLLTDIFHADRWDYVFRLKKGNGEEISSKLTVFFDGDRLREIVGGDDLPTEAEYLAYIAGTKK